MTKKPEIKKQFNVVLVGEIENLMIEKFHYKRGDFHMCMAKIIAYVFGDVSGSNTRSIAGEIFASLLEVETIPEEIRQGGVDACCDFLCEYDYHVIKLNLLAAAKLANLRSSEM